MNRKTYLTSLLILSIAAVMFSACKEKEDVAVPTTSSGYVLALRAQDGATATADYLLTASDLMTGTISATGKGIEQDGWCYYGATGNTFCSFGYSQNQAVGYKVENGTLVEKGKFIFERMDCTNPVGDGKTLVSIGAPWGGGSYDCNLQIVDVESMSIQKSVKHPIYKSKDSTGNQLNAWPTDSYVENGKLYVSFYPLNGVSWETPQTDTAYVSVFEYPSLTYLKTFKDTRTGPIGYYGDQPCIIKDENGNHYTISNTSIIAGFTQSTKPSGILKIKAGTDSFDKDYFFNVEADKGYKVLTATYVGNGLAVARVVVKDDASMGTWGTFTKEKVPCKMVILDLFNKTVTDVANIPMHSGQYQTPFLVENGKVYVSISTIAENYIYKIDPLTATGTKGAKIEGVEIQGFFKY
jgi:hypothetical protein